MTRDQIIINQPNLQVASIDEKKKKKQPTIDYYATLPGNSGFFAQLDDDSNALFNGISTFVGYLIQKPSL